MGEAARKFLDRLVLRVGGTASERARYRCYAEQRLACVNADGAARLVLSFKNHIRRCGGTVVRTARDLRLPQVPEAPVDTHRPREATAVDSAETTIVPACPNFTTGAHAILAHQDILGGWRWVIEFQSCSEFRGRTGQGSRLIPGGGGLRALCVV